MKKLLPLILLLVISCSESATDPRSDPRGIIVTGSVIDGVTGQPMRGQTVSIEKLTSDGLFGPVLEERITSTASAADGSYSMSVSRADGTSYVVKTDVKANLTYAGDDFASPPFLGDRIQLAPGENLNTVLQLQPTAKVVVVPQTDRPLAAGDEFTINVTSSAGGGSVINMRNEPKTHRALIAGDRMTVSWTVIRNGVREYRLVGGEFPRHELMTIIAEY